MKEKQPTEKLKCVESLLEKLTNLVKEAKELNIEHEKAESESDKDFDDLDRDVSHLAYKMKMAITPFIDDRNLNLSFHALGKLFVSFSIAAEIPRDLFLDYTKEAFDIHKAQKDKVMPKIEKLKNALSELMKSAQE